MVPSSSGHGVPQPKTGYLPNCCHSHRGQPSLTCFQIVFSTTLHEMDPVRVVENAHNAENMNRDTGDHCGITWHLREWGEGEPGQPMGRELPLILSAGILMRSSLFRPHHPIASEDNLKKMWNADLLSSVYATPRIWSTFVSRRWKIMEKHASQTKISRSYRAVTPGNRLKYLKPKCISSKSQGLLITWGVQVPNSGLQKILDI